MKVLVLTTSYPLFAESVSGIFIRRLLENMPDNVQCLVVAPYDPYSDSSALDQENIRVKIFQYAPKFLSKLAHRPGGIPVALKQNRFLYLIVPFFLLSMLLVTLRYIRGTDVIHANWAISGLIAGFIGRITGIPVITTLRGSDVPQADTKTVNQWILSKALTLSTQIVTVSQALKVKMKTEYPDFSARISVIENGVGDEFLSLATARRESAAISKPTTEKITNLLTIGSLIPRKGVVQIFEALSVLTGESVYFLHVVGDGPLRKVLEKTAQDLGIANRVNFLGTIDADKIPALLEQVDIFVLASHWEGRPNAVIEAMAAGLPVIASDIAGMNELVVDGKTGLLFTDGDSHALSSCIKKLSENSEQAFHYGQAGSKRIREMELHWSNTAQQYLNLYQACLAVAAAGKR